MKTTVFRTVVNSGLNLKGRINENKRRCAWQGTETEKSAQRCRRGKSESQEIEERKGSQLRKAAGIQSEAV